MTKLKVPKIKQAIAYSAIACFISTVGFTMALITRIITVCDPNKSTGNQDC